MRRLFLLALLATSAFPARAPAQADSASASLRPGDLIRLAVWRQPDFSGEFAVGPEGTVQHPLLADVVVAGVPRPVVRERLARALGRYERDPNFVFEFLYRIPVGGEVRAPNLYTLTPENTVSQAVAAAGGANELGRMDRVYVLRGASEVVLDLRDPRQAATRLRSGDQIRVGRRSNVLRDNLGPAAAIIGAAAALVSIVVSLGNN
ncbi:MAG TPA: polysaccharide biosynthesis/export family protein [Longimicrobium sp.]|jgi:polysaccharide export outer membrane protein